jgi:prephenate dehydrogenase
MLFSPCHSFTVPDNFKVPSGMQRSVSIIGLGNWGSSLARALGVAGVALHEVIVPSARSAVGYAGWARTLPLTTLDRAQLEADVLWLCVPDAAIARVTGRLVKRVAKRVGNRGLKGQIVRSFQRRAE